MLLFALTRDHEFWEEVWGYIPHHKDRTRLDRCVTDNALWQNLWKRLAAQLGRWYVTQYRVVGWRFTECLVKDWRRLCERR